MSQLPISVIIPVKNEEQNIRRCLASVEWVSEVVVIDTESTDNTVGIAKEFKNTKIISTPWLGYSATKRFGVEHTSFVWILWLDADEVVTEELKQEIIAVFSRNEQNYSAYKMKRKNWFVDTFLDHNWYPDYVTRFFNKEQAFFNQNILHEGLEIPGNGKLGSLDSHILHYSYTSLQRYFEKLIHYGPLGAEEAVRKGKKFRIIDIFFRPGVTFVRMYFLKKGFLDGIPGLIVCLGSAFSTFVRYSHLYYLTKNK